MGQLVVRVGNVSLKCERGHSSVLASGTRSNQKQMSRQKPAPHLNFRPLPCTQAIKTHPKPFQYHLLRLKSSSWTRVTEFSGEGLRPPKSKAGTPRARAMKAALVNFYNRLASISISREDGIAVASRQTSCSCAPQVRVRIRNVPGSRGNVLNRPLATAREPRYDPASLNKNIGTICNT